MIREVSLSLCILVVTLGLSAVAQANQGPPRPRPAKGEAPLEVALQEAGRLRIEIPRGLLPKEADAEGKEAGIFAPSKWRTIFSGMILSLALGFGGLWLARRLGAPSAPRLSAAHLVMVLVMAGLVGTIAWANAPAPPRIADEPRIPAEVGQLTVQISIVEKGAKVVLHASPDDLAKLAALTKPAPAKSAANAEK